MKLISVEPTPSPNTMKLNMDEKVEQGRTYNKENIARAPLYIQELLGISGVKSIFQTADFIAVDRFPNGDWQQILAEVGRILDGEEAISQLEESDADGFGEARIFVQTFRGIPMQIRVKTNLREVREGMSQRFMDAAVEAGMASPNLIKERKLEDRGVRYGELEEIAQEVMQELEAGYSDERLQTLIKRSKEMKEDDAPIVDWYHPTPQEAWDALDSDDWRIRYQAMDQLELTEEMLPVLEKGVRDEHVSVRRLAVVWLGEIEGQVDFRLRLLCEAMEDRSPIIRRTAGDALSDIGDARATPTMIQALSDKNKLVRWRAARFLFDLGDETAIDALRKAAEDTEFEVALQARIALERIEGGKEAEGTIWQQMTNRNQ